MVSKTTKVSREKKRGTKKELKAEPGQLRDYELTLVISPEVTEDKLNKTLDNLSQLITSLGGAISDVSQWGKRKLAYPVNNFSEGTYILAQLKLNPDQSRELEAKLHISEQVIRHLLINLS